MSRNAKEAIMADELIARNGMEVSSCGWVTDQSMDELLDNCILTARNLLFTANEETAALRGFKTDQLSQVIPRKEALANELNLKVRTLHALSNGRHHQDQGEKRSTLKRFMTEIERCNYNNHIFIQGSLSFWQDLLNLFIPGTYAPAEQGLLRRRQPSAKGLAFNKEA